MQLLNQICCLFVVVVVPFLIFLFLFIQKTAHVVFVLGIVYCVLSVFLMQAKCLHYYSNSDMFPNNIS